MKKNSDNKIRYLLIIVGLIIVSVGLFVWQGIRYNRAITRKNISLVKTIDELLQTKSKDYNKLPERLDDLSAGILDDSFVPDIRGESNDRIERSRFENMRRGIVEQKLYLDPNLSRMVLLEKYKIPKNSFSQLFQKYAGKSYSNYINDLRLEYAAKMLKEYPNHTVESVAIDCGISSVGTLYKLFSKKYGMTPTVYRSLIESHKSEKDNDNDSDNEPIEE